MAAPNLDDLFENSRVLEWDWTILLVILYTPLGVLLSLIRMFGLLQFYIMFMYFPYNSFRRYILRTFAAVLGVVVHEHNDGKFTRSLTHIWVSNHLSPFDKLILQILGAPSNSIVFPECETTNGKKGLLKFQPKILDQQKQQNLNLQIQPIALSVSRPFPSLSVSTLDSQLWIDSFFLFFCPFTIFSVRFLEPASQREGEDMENLLRRVEEAIGNSLGISTTPFTAKDKDELIKRKRVPIRHFPENRLNTSLQAMASQVKEVLPHVPMATILRDLGRTNSIDLTIANLVEGVVPFVPEPITRGGGNIASTPCTSQPLSQLHVPSANFGRSAQERGLSLQERKQRFIQEARRRYCEKHGLKIAGVNC